MQLGDGVYPEPFQLRQLGSLMNFPAINVDTILMGHSSSDSNGTTVDTTEEGRKSLRNCWRNETVAELGDSNCVSK